MEIQTVDPYNSRLYQLTGGMALIAEELEDAINDPDISEEARNELVAAIFERFQNFREATEQKIEGVICKRRELMADADAFEKEADFFWKKAKRAKAAIAWLESYLKDNLRALEGRKVNTVRFRATLKITPGGRLEIIDEQLLPSPKKHPEFYRFVPARNDLAKDELKKAMKAGFECAGAKLTDSESLSIR